MTVIVREGRWRIEVFTKEHGQPHVHVLTADGMVKVLLREAP